MSLPGKDFRCKLDEELHQRLRLMAEFQNVQISALGAELLEEMISAKWYTYSKLVARVSKGRA